MAIDKAIDSAQLDSGLSSLADAIRAKGGTSASLAFPSGFVTAVGNISGVGGTVYTGTIELLDTNLTSLIIPVDVSNASNYIVTAYIEKTGVVSGGVTTFDEEPIANSSSNTIWYVAAAKRYESRSMKYDSTHYASATRPANIVMQYVRQGNNGAGATVIEPIASGTNIVIPSGNASRYFSTTGCYMRFAYRVDVM